MSSRRASSPVPGSHARPLVRCGAAVRIPPCACSSSVIRQMWLIVSSGGGFSRCLLLPALVCLPASFARCRLYPDTPFAPSWRVGERGVLDLRASLSLVICLFSSGSSSWAVRLVAGWMKKNRGRVFFPVPLLARLFFFSVGGLLDRSVRFCSRPGRSLGNRFRLSRLCRIGRGLRPRSYKTSACSIYGS